jgi:hypothetical protein
VRDTNPEKEVLEELEVFVKNAANVARKAWEESSKANEQAAQRTEAYREITSMASAALDALTRAAKIATKAIGDMTQKTEEAPAE